MLYLVTGKLATRELLTGPHEETVQVFQNRILPSISLLLELQAAGQVLAGGVPAGTREVVFILRLAAGESHLSIRRLLYRLPVFPHYEWDVTPLESFDEWLTLLKG